MKKGITRREALKSGIATAALATIQPMNWLQAPGNSPIPGNDRWQGYKMGIASYSFRKFTVEDTIKALQGLGLHYISIKDFHLPLKSTTAERKAVVAKFKAAGITPLSCGNITMNNTEESVRQAFEYARDCDMPTIVCSPDPQSMPLLDKMVKEFDIRIAIHNHGPEDKRFPDPATVWKLVKDYDKRIGLCIDIGHTARAKTDPAAAIRQYQSRLYDLHFKDIDTTAPNGTTVAGGRGVLNLPAVWKSLIKIKYSGLISVEFENSPDNPYPEVAETIGYAKGILDTLTA